MPAPVERLSGVERLLVVGDVQSNYASLVAMLAAAGFAEERDGVPVWTAGTATLLFLGDLLDGGRQPAEVVWLVIRLHEQAAAAGGRVALVQGNHELMLLALAAAEGADLTPALRSWFANGGLETLLRLAGAVGITVPEPLVAQMFTAVLSDAETDPEVQTLARAVVKEWAPEITFLRGLVRSAVAVNRRLLAVHASPNFDADGLDGQAREAADEITLAWSRRWLDGWRPSDPVFMDRMAALRARLHAPGDFDLRILLFAHTPLRPFAVPGYRDALYRIGRLAGLEGRAETPSVFCLMVAPREMPRGGAMGGLLIEDSGLTAVYGSEVTTVDGDLPMRERLQSFAPGEWSSLPPG